MASKLLDKSSLPDTQTIDNKQCIGRGPELLLSNPKNASHIITLRAASEDDIDDAVKFAQRAFNGEWSDFPATKRAECINRYADLLEQHAPEIAYFESIASGRPISMIIWEVGMAAGVLRYYAGWADKIKGDMYPADDGYYKIVRHEPLGVCVGITAWNSSLNFLSWKAGPALACGNTVIIKPSEKSPLGSLAAGRLIEAAGFPPGVFQILCGDGRAGTHFCNHMGVQKVSFTGSSATGRKIQEASAKSNLKRVTLELGGKSPGIVFEDADLDAAVATSVFGITVNTGQVCAATSRLLLQESIATDFIERMKAQFIAIAENLGSDPQDMATTYGPLVDKGQLERVLGYIRAGKETSQILCGGANEESRRGCYVAPTIFLNPKSDDPIYKEEIFGPVLCIKTFKDEEEAIALANDTEYGLAGAVFTENMRRALRTSAKLRAGTVSINCVASVGAQVPMGGFGISGLGRELGEYALRHYTEPKAIWIKMT